MAMIHAIPIIIEKAGSPMIGLSARITLFVVVCVPLLTVFFRVEIEDQVNTWSSISTNDCVTNDGKKQGRGRAPVFSRHLF